MEEELVMSTKLKQLFSEDCLNLGSGSGNVVVTASPGLPD